jgi:hypothetical protein
MASCQGKAITSLAGTHNNDEGRVNEKIVALLRLPFVVSSFDMVFS